MTETPQGAQRVECRGWRWSARSPPSRVKKERGGFQGHKNQRNSSHYCPGVVPRPGGIRGWGDFCREIAHWGFQLPSSNLVAFSLIVNYLAESLIMQWKTASLGYKAHKLKQPSTLSWFLFTRLQIGRGEEQSEQPSSIRNILSAKDRKWWNL